MTRLVFSRSPPFRKIVNYWVLKGNIYSITWADETWTELALYSRWEDQSPAWLRLLKVFSFLFSPRHIQGLQLKRCMHVHPSKHPPVRVSKRLNVELFSSRLVTEPPGTPHFSLTPPPPCHPDHDVSSWMLASVMDQLFSSVFSVSAILLTVC